MRTFEWDETKRERVLAERGLDFRDAARIFTAPTVIAPSHREGERRWIAIGMLDGIEIAVIFTIRGEACRIITARRARRHERETYRANLS